MAFARHGVPSIVFLPTECVHSAAIARPKSATVASLSKVLHAFALRRGWHPHVLHAPLHATPVRIAAHLPDGPFQMFGEQSANSGEHSFPDIGDTRRKEFHRSLRRPLW